MLVARPPGMVTRETVQGLIDPSQSDPGDGPGRWRSLIDCPGYHRIIDLPRLSPAGTNETSWCRRHSYIRRFSRRTLRP
jgi:hypothetical protein